MAETSNQSDTACDIVTQTSRRHFSERHKLALRALKVDQTREIAFSKA